MKKKTRNLFIMLAVLLVVGGAVAALILTQPGEQAEDDVASPLTVTELLTYEAADIESISIITANGGKTLVPYDNAGTAEFMIDGYSAEKQKTENILSMAQTLYKLSASKELGAVANPAEFGLAGDGEAKITLTAKDGRIEYTVGIKPGESSGRYVLLDGKVYICAGLSERIFEDAYAFFDLQLYTVADNEDGADYLEELTLSGTDFPEEIRIEGDDARVFGYAMTAPVYGDANGDFITSELIPAIKSISAAKLITETAKEADLKEFGLADFAARAEFTLNGESHIVTVSAKDADGMRYIMHNGDESVYQISNSAVEIWAESGVMDLRSSLILMPNIMGVQNITLTGGREFAFTAARQLDEENSTEGNPVYDISVQMNGKDVEYEDYQEFYKQLIGLSILSYEQAEYGENAAYTIKYDYFDASGSDILTFHTVNDERYALEINGVFGGVVKASLLDELMAAAGDLIE